MAYFEYFPTIGYDAYGDKNNSRISQITNVLVRLRKKLNVINSAFFEQHFINDGDRADILAHKFYGDSTLHWVVMYANYMTNPYYDWPLAYYDLRKFVTKKYSNVNDIHHYEDSDGYIVDSTESGAVPVTNFTYEERLNDEKRTINIIRSEYIPQILNEFKKATIE
jgi:hypothetical protein